MKLLIVCAGLAALFGTSALAADLPVKTPPPPATGWTGCYADAGVGYGMWNQDSHSETFPGLVPIGAPVTSAGRGWLGRVGGGCDYQIASRFVVGAFGDYDFMNLSGNLADPSGPAEAGENQTGAWYAGGRIGYLISPSLLTYFDGGYTGTHFNQVDLNGPLGAPSPFSFGAATYQGWFVDGGTDTALSSLSTFLPGLPLPAGLFLRTEYRYASYQPADNQLFITTTGAPFRSLSTSRNMCRPLRPRWSGGSIGLLRPRRRLPHLRRLSC